MDAEETDVRTTRLSHGTTVIFRFRKPHNDFGRVILTQGIGLRLNLHLRPAVGTARRDFRCLSQHGRHPKGIHSTQGKNLPTREADPVGSGSRREGVRNQNGFFCRIEGEQVHGHQPQKDLPNLDRRKSALLRKGHGRWGCSRSKTPQDMAPHLVLLGIEASSAQSVRNGLHSVRQPHLEAPLKVTGFCRFGCRPRCAPRYSLPCRGRDQESSAPACPPRGSTDCGPAVWWSRTRTSSNRPDD